MKKFKNNILFKNIMILLLGGATSKILGMVGKIIFTRIAGVNVVALYTLITPTLMLIIALTQFSFPISISKLSAEEKYDNNSLLKSAYFIGIIVDIILIIMVIFTSNVTANMLHSKALETPIKSIILIIPFVTVSSIQRGFLHGKEDMLAPSITSITEEVIKIILSFLILPYAILKGRIIAITSIILFNIVMELVSILIMKNTINKKYLNKNKGYVKLDIIKEILGISMPTTSVRLISQIGFFLEPIILTNTLVNSGLSSNYITLEYGIINSYITPLLSMPTFFSISIAAALLPNITKAYYNKKYKEFNSKIRKLMLISILIGIISLVVILGFPYKILKLVYGVTYGINYLYIIGPFFIILYLQPTLSVSLQAMNKTNKLFIISIISITIKYIVLYILCKSGFGIKGFLYTIITGIVITTSLMMYFTLKEIKKQE